MLGDDVDVGEVMKPAQTMLSCDRCTTTRSSLVLDACVGRGVEREGRRR